MKDVYKLPLPPGGLVSESLLAESGAASEVSNYAEQLPTSPSTRSTIAPQYFTSTSSPSSQLLYIFISSPHQRLATTLMTEQLLTRHEVNYCSSIFQPHSNQHLHIFSSSQVSNYAEQLSSSPHPALRGELYLLNILTSTSSPSAYLLLTFINFSSSQVSNYTVTVNTSPLLTTPHVIWLGYTHPSSIF